MDNIIDLIENSIIDLVYIEENDTVQDGCFAISPYLTSFLKGNGVPVVSSTQGELVIFYKDKSELVETCNDVVTLLSENKIVCSDISYTYDQNGLLYRANFTVNF